MILGGMYSTKMPQFSLMLTACLCFLLSDVGKYFIFSLLLTTLYYWPKVQLQLKEACLSEIKGTTIPLGHDNITT